MDNTYQEMHESCICREYAVHILLGYILDSAFKQGIDSIIKDTRDAGLADAALPLCLCTDWEIWDKARSEMFDNEEVTDND